MKFIKLFFLTLITFSCIIQASQLRSLLAFGSSIFAARPLFLNSYHFSQNRHNRDALIPTLDDTDPVVQRFISEHLQKYGYKNFETLPIKTRTPSCDDPFKMKSLLDNCLALSTDYESQIKSALSASSELSGEKSKEY